MARRPAGQIYGTADVLRYARTSFLQTAVGPFSVKGKSRPVQAWRGPAGEDRCAGTAKPSCRSSGASRSSASCAR